MAWRLQIFIFLAFVNCAWAIANTTAVHAANTSQHSLFTLSDSSVAVAPAEAPLPTSAKYRWRFPPSPPAYLASYEQTYTFWSLIWGLSINAAIGVICLLLFGWLRLTSVYGAKLFRPRQLLMDIQQREREREAQSGEPQTLVGKLKELNTEMPLKSLPPLPAGGWIKFLLEIPDSDIVQFVGLDALVFIRFYGLCVQLFLPTTILILVSLGPVYWFGDGLDRRGRSYSGPDRMTINNLPHASSLYWAPILCCYFVSCLFIYLLASENREIMRLRLRFVCSLVPAPHEVAVLVTDIPSTQRSDERDPNEAAARIADVATGALQQLSAISKHDSLKGDGQATADQVEAYFRALYPGLGVFPRAVMVPRVADVDKAWASRNAAAMALHVANARIQLAARERAPVPAARAEELRAQQASALAELAELERALRKLRNRALRRTSHTAFVIFPSRVAATTAAQTLHSSEGGQYWRVQPAPEQREVVWRNMHYRWWERLGRFSLAVVFTALIVLNFLIIVAFVASLVTLRNLERYMPKLAGWVSTSQRAEAFYNGYFASFVLLGALFGAPIAFRFLARVQGLISRSDVEYTVSLRYFWLLVIDVFFGSAVLQSAMRQFGTLLTSFSLAEVAASVAASVPGASQFFIAFLLTRSGTAFALQLLRVYNLPSLLTRLPRCWTVAEERSVWAPPEPAYGDWGPTVLFVLFLGLVYAPIAPAVLPVVLVFFSFGFIVFRYQLLYVYASAYQARERAAYSLGRLHRRSRPPSALMPHPLPLRYRSLSLTMIADVSAPFSPPATPQTHGRLWLHLLATSVDCLLMAQLVLLAILVSRQDHYEWVALLPLVGGTFLFGFVMDKNYSSAFRTIPRDVAEAADAAGPAVDEDNRLPFPFPEAFMPPCMYDDTVLDPDRLLTEAEKQEHRDAVFVGGAGRVPSRAPSEAVDEEAGEAASLRSGSGAASQRGYGATAGDEDGWWTAPLSVAAEEEESQSVAGGVFQRERDLGSMRFSGLSGSAGSEGAAGTFARRRGEPTPSVGEDLGRGSGGSLASGSLAPSERGGGGGRRGGGSGRWAR